MNEQNPISRRAILPLLAAAGVGAAAAPFLGETAAEAATSSLQAGTPLGWINVRHFGAIGDGVTDDTGAITKAITALPSGSGVVYFPPGQYLVTAPLILDNRIGITFMGGGATTLTSTVAGAGPAISCHSAAGIRFERMIFQCASGLNGNFIDCDWSTANADVQNIYVEACQFGINGQSSSSPRCWIRLSRTLGSEVRRCSFLYGTYAVVNGDKSDRGNGNGYGIANTVDGCAFNYQEVAAIYSAGSTEAARYVNNVFEALATGKPNGILQAPASGTNWSTVVEGNWWGDVSAAGGTYVTLYHGLGSAVIGNRMSTLLGPNDAHIALNQCQGVAIVGNRCEAGVGIDSTPSAPGYCYDIVIFGNDLGSTNTKVKPANISTGWFLDGPSITAYNSANGFNIGVDVAVAMALGLGGQFYAKTLGLMGATTGTTSPAAGGAGVLPTTPAGYVTVSINGTDRQIPYY